LKKERVDSSLGLRHGLVMQCAISIDSSNLSNPTIIGIEYKAEYNYTNNIL